MKFSRWTHLLMCLSLETLTSIIRTGLPFLGELIDLVNSAIIFQFQAALLRWLTFLLASCCHGLTVLLFWISFFLLMLVFALQWLSLHWEILIIFFVSVSIDFPSNWHWDALFYCITYHYSCADWDGLHDPLRDVLWEDIFKLSASATASEFCEWVQVGIDVYMPHSKYQVKSHSSPWFSAVFAVAIVHRSHFFCFVPKR